MNCVQCKGKLRAGWNERYTTCSLLCTEIMIDKEKEKQESTTELESMRQDIETLKRDREDLWKIVGELCDKK